MSTYQQRDETGMAIGHTEVISETIDQTIAKIIAKREAVKKAIREFQAESCRCDLSWSLM